jgi:hypothetical protein
MADEEKKVTEETTEQEAKEETDKKEPVEKMEKEEESGNGKKVEEDTEPQAAAYEKAVDEPEAEIKAEEVQEDTVKDEAEAKAEEEPEKEAEIDQEETAETAQKEEKPLDKMTAKELREIAVEIPGIIGAHAMKKEQLLEAIKEARGIKDEAPIKEKERQKVKGNIKALKEKIHLLKEEKRTARDARDKNKVDILRRRINRLKKQTRKVAQA